MRCRSSGYCRYRSRLSYSTVPSSAGRIPVSAFSSVDLPAPLGPMTPTKHRSGIGNVAASSSNLPPPTVTFRPRASNVTSPVSTYSPQFPVGQAECGVADADNVLVADLGAVYPLAVQERAVVAAQVDDLVPATRGLPQFGVAAGDAQVVDGQVVVGSAADPHDPHGQRQHGRRPAIHARHGLAGVRPYCRGRGRDHRVEAEQRSVLGVAEADEEWGENGEPGYPFGISECAICTSRILQNPDAVLGAQYRVPPRYARIVEEDSRVRIASDAVFGSGMQRVPGTPRSCLKLRHRPRLFSHRIFHRRNPPVPLILKNA
jgi:hypothetical protein